MPFNELVLADGNTPSVMEAVIHAMFDFRREMLDNLKLSLEYHTEQLEEIKYHVENVIKEQEHRITNRVRELQDNVHRMQSQIVKLDSDETSLQLEKIANALDQPNMRLVPTSCDEIKSASSGTFSIRPYGSTEKPFMVLCNFENKFNLGGGWTVFQRRLDGSVDFYRNWESYKNGFGDVNGEHWLGLEKLHRMTKSGGHELLVLLEDFEEKEAYAFYDDFKVGNEAEKYKLTVGKYSGTAGDKLTYHNQMKFSARDQDNDLSDSKAGCANSFKGAWWFENCYKSNLNGQYYQKGYHLEKTGVEWMQFPSANYSLKSTTMMFRNRT
ncbi:AGAP012000-PA-like protein [Anopheles sinensis]|uniref:AGAP012000-PA-like protein n=1 Tax=Anopheles sinensis TaxID=74873 RepID=A0A084WK34_ANOSI|nr:AGAP012000-PA-like protein [Anopheles sinensis]